MGSSDMDSQLINFKSRQVQKPPGSKAARFESRRVESYQARTLHAVPVALPDCISGAPNARRGDHQILG
jgi:hypothetical protein